MELLLDFSTFRGLRVLLMRAKGHTAAIKASIAFNSSDELIQLCLKNKIKLEWWGLFNSSFSTNIDLIEKALGSDHIRFYPIADNFHPKLIHFEGFGLYIGSANMTEKALNYNVETGVFITEEELHQQNLKEKLAAYFNYLRENSIPVNKQDLEALLEYQEEVTIHISRRDIIEEEIKQAFEDKFSHLFTVKKGAIIESDSRTRDQKRASREEKRKHAFLQEWRSTQQFIARVKELLMESKKLPAWVDVNAGYTIITDQLLHAHYFQNVFQRNGNIQTIEDLYERNRKDPTEAILAAIHWWANLEAAPMDEDMHINRWAIENKDLLSKAKVKALSLEEFTRMLMQNHAARNHARQIRNSFFNLDEEFETDISGRVRIFAEWLYKQGNKKGMSILEAIYYLLHDENEQIEDRVFHLAADNEYKIEHFGKSIIGELAGWGRPDIALIRNNRVNKALRSLGYDVMLY